MNAQIKNTGQESEMSDRVVSFIQDPKIAGLAHEFRQALERREVNIGFNAFALVSDVYHRENFHSDIIAAILDPAGDHGHGDRFLGLFLEFLRDHHRCPITPENYKHATVEREPDRMDILIADETNQTAIIVENKINGAPDMHRQLPRYFQKVKARGLECEAIVYLALIQSKEPDRTEWGQDREVINKLLRPVCAYEDAPRDLCNGWLQRCTESSEDSRVTHVIGQYRDLLLKLGSDAMNIPVMEKYYDLLRAGGNFETASALVAMFNDMPAYRCHRLFESVRDNHEPFTAIVPNYGSALLLKGFRIGSNTEIRVDVLNSFPKQSLLIFWSPTDQSLPGRILAELGLESEFPERENSHHAKVFQFPSHDDDLHAFLKTFLQRLRDYKPSAL
ncbi:MAG TPA: PD-(D/E)XK nuclease family protein [Prosthecobacter sp.]|nr:PD-(D/E)XK nuclease family protein [Prosthecobacter sp.]